MPKQLPTAGSVLCLVALLGTACVATRKPETGAAPDGEKGDKKKPFASVVEDATTIDGLFRLYETEEKVLLEIQPEQLDRVYFLALTVDSGLGERGFYAAQMGGMAPIAFHREGDAVQLVVRNLRFLAEPELAVSRAVERSFSDSILAQAELASAPHPERGSLLVDLGDFLLSDLPALGNALETTFRIPYAFDGERSSFGRLKGFEENMEIELQAVYAVDKLPVPPMSTPDSPPPPRPPPPRNLPDPRSLSLTLHWSLAEPPPPGFEPRWADDRVGHFFTDHENFSSDVAYVPTVRLVNRWRLEKQDPEAAVSPPVRPIVFWLENTIPEGYRDVVREGILLWNEAFERIGFENAIEVRQQPDDAEWGAGDLRYATVRWFATTDASFAQGPSIADPRSGEILDADIRFAESVTRFTRRARREQVEPVAGQPAGQQPVSPLRLSPWLRPVAGQSCDLAPGLVAQASFGTDLLLARGMDPEGPEAEEFLRQFLVYVTAHEVGHTLGLRHNFRASTIHPLGRVHDQALTRREGLVGSMMEYAPVNLSVDPGSQGEYFPTTLGPYDHWAIEYAYKPLAASTAEGKAAELAEIAARAGDPMLAYATDEDAGLGAGAWNMDPYVNRNDLGSDPLAFAAQRVRLSRELWQNIEATLEQPGEGYQVLRRSFSGALGQVGLAADVAAKFIGGIEHPRTHVDDPDGGPPLRPVSRELQEQALELLREYVFSPRAFEFSPQLLNKLASERWPDLRNFSASVNRRYDYPVHEQVLEIQRRVLDRLFDPTVLARVVDSEMTQEDPFRVATLFAGLDAAIWDDLDSGSGALEIRSFRRNLQRAHVKRLVVLVLAAPEAVPEDARTQARASLEALGQRIQRAQRSGRADATTDAYLGESRARIEAALAAGADRQAF